MTHDEFESQVADEFEKTIAVVDPDKAVDFAALFFEVRRVTIQAYQYRGWLPTPLTLRDVLTIRQDPALSKWREMTRARRKYVIACCTPPEGIMSAEETAKRICPDEDIASLRQQARIMRMIRGPAVGHDYCEDALNLGLEERHERQAAAIH